MEHIDKPHGTGGEGSDKEYEPGDLYTRALWTTEYMRQAICDIFDKDPAPSQGKSPEAIENARAENVKLPASLQELRKRALAAHDEWAGSVLQRIAEAMSAPDVEESETHRPHPPASEGQVDEEGVESHKSAPASLHSPHSTFSGEMAIQVILLSLLSLQNYDARSRTFLLCMAEKSLNIPLSVVISQELEMARTLIAASKNMSAEEESKKRAEKSKSSKRWKVGLASVAGAAVIGVTGGLAAPLVAAGVGGLMSGIGLGATAVAGYLGAMAGSGAIVGALFGAYGGKMSGEVVERYAAEVNDFAFIPVHNKENRLRVTIGITGWLTAPEEVTLPWKLLNANPEVYALRWEMNALLDLGTSLESILKSYAWSYVKSEIIKRTVLASLWAALWPIGLLKAARVIDNPFSIAKHRSEKAGRVLADAIVNKAQGERPVTLVGFSLGARVVYFCLLELAARGAYGLVENAVLMGAPVPCNRETWSAVRSVVAGRVVNVFSERDYILAFLYRTSSVQLGVAGLQAVQVPHVENVNVGGRVEGHLRYRHMVGVILKDVFGEDVQIEEVRKEKEILRDLEEKEKEEQDMRKGEEGDDLEGQIDNAVAGAEKELEERRRNREMEQ